MGGSDQEIGYQSQEFMSPHIFNTASRMTFLQQRGIDFRGVDDVDLV